MRSRRRRVGLPVLATAVISALAGVALVGPTSAAGTDSLTVTVVDRGPGDSVRLFYFRGDRIASIDCSGGTCEASDVNAGEPYWLRVDPADPAGLVGFDGACAADIGHTCMRAGVAAHSEVTVTFAVASLTIEKAGAGAGVVTSDTGGIDCGSVCVGSFSKVSQSRIRLTATAAGGANVFLGWSGLCAAHTGPVCVLDPTDPGFGSSTADGAGKVTAVFGAGSRILEVQRTGNGSGRVTATLDGIAVVDCGQQCRSSEDALEFGDQVHLVASASSGSYFVGWSGDCDGREVTCVLTLGPDTRVVAEFGAGVAVFNVVRPSVSGTPMVGSELTARPGAWVPNDGLVVDYQWLRSGAEISGATGVTYVVTDADVGHELAVRATASADGYVDNSRASLPVGPVPEVEVEDLPMIAARPNLRGRPVIGTVLRVRVGTWSPGVELTYRWFAGGKRIRGETDPTMRLGGVHRGKRVSVAVTGRKDGYATTTMTSARTQPVRGRR